MYMDRYISNCAQRGRVFKVFFKEIYLAIFHVSGELINKLEISYNTGFYIPPEYHRGWRDRHDKKGVCSNCTGVFNTVARLPWSVVKHPPRLSLYLSSTEWVRKQDENLMDWDKDRKIAYKSWASQTQLGKIKIEIELEGQVERGFEQLEWKTCLPGDKDESD